jgi:mRNA interferase HigB
VRVIARKTLIRFLDSLAGHKDHKAVKGSLDSWFQEATNSEWRSPSDIKKHYRNASIVGEDRFVFNIKGNSYRLVVAIDYERGIVFIKWIGNHADYDKIDVRTIQYDGSSD